MIGRGAGAGNSRAALRHIVEEHLTPYLRTGRLRLREGVGADGTVVGVAHAVRAELTMRDGAIDGVVRNLALEELPGLDLDLAVGVFGTRVPRADEHSALLFGFLDALDRLDAAALTRESWLLLLERSDELTRPRLD